VGVSHAQSSFQYDITSQ